MYVFTLTRISFILILQDDSMPKTAKQMERIILKDGWRLVKQRGSHRQYVHPYKPGKITIPFHNRDLKPGTEARIYKLAKIDKKEADKW